MFEEDAWRLSLVENGFCEAQQNALIFFEGGGIIETIFGDSDKLVRANAGRLRNRNMLLPLVGRAFMSQNHHSAQTV